VVDAHTVPQLKQPNFIIDIANLCDGVIPEGTETVVTSIRKTPGYAAWQVPGGSRGGQTRSHLTTVIYVIPGGDNVSTSFGGKFPGTRHAAAPPGDPVDLP
jgi:hypothetical protein